MRKSKSSKNNVIGLSTILNPEYINTAVNPIKIENEIINHENSKTDRITEFLGKISKKSRQIDTLKNLSTSSEQSESTNSDTTSDEDTSSDGESANLSASSSDEEPKKYKIKHIKKSKHSEQFPEYMTYEQERKQQLESVMNDIRMSGSNIGGSSIEKVRIKDSKASLISEIQQLYKTLEAEEVDGYKEIELPTEKDNIDDITACRDLLKLKLDRIRLSGFAEDVVYALAEGLETTFDGTRAIPIFGWKPDYTNFSSTIAVKMSRMRYDTSNIVGKILERLHVGPTMRVAIELIPSIITYPRMRQKRTMKPTIGNQIIYQQMNKK